jgi:ubiquinone/menaquinone biosynthesis C-methylase UbiE
MADGMHRVLEPEVMDTVEDAQEYDAMDFVEPNTRFAVDALALLGAVSRPEILDVGTGTARIPILMVQRRPDLSILGIDLAREMLRVGEANVAAAGLQRQISLELTDAKRLALASDRFDMVTCNSTIHHLPDPLLGFREIERVTKPGGAIIIRDLVRPKAPEDAWAIVERVAAGESPHQKQLFFDSLCASLTLDDVRGALERVGLEELSVRMVSDRHWTAEGRKPA